jgi:hypothetical protein
MVPIPVVRPAVTMDATAMVVMMSIISPLLVECALPRTGPWF